MADQIVLENLSPTPFVATLHHDSYCKYGAPCACRQESFMGSVRNQDTGEVGFRTGMRNVPDSISIAGRGKSAPLSPAIKRVPGIAEALRNNQLRAIVVPTTPAAAVVKPLSPLVAPEVEVRSSRKHKD